MLPIIIVLFFKNVLALNPFAICTLGRGNDFCHWNFDRDYVESTYLYGEENILKLWNLYR